MEQKQQKEEIINKTKREAAERCQEDVLRSVTSALERYGALVVKEQSFRLELDGPEGQNAFRSFMEVISQLGEAFNAIRWDRTFRQEYTNAYRVLYHEGCPGYIPEIFDSAQEAFPFIYVNGRRFDFSAQVLTKGETLIDTFYKVAHLLRLFAVGSGEQEGRNQLRIGLEDLDAAWVAYQRSYIGELIEIEKQSKAGILAVIKIQQELTAFEREQKLKGRIFISGPQYDNLRKRLSNEIARLNSVANTDGKGRDDLGFQVLLGAQKVLATITDFQSRSVRAVAERIRQSFQNIREVLRFFKDNFEMVDPQLKNNPELVAALLEYEVNWQKGKRYFLQGQKQRQIIALSTTLDAAKEKYPSFAQLLECSDPAVFWLIPSLILLRSLQGEDQGLTEVFLKQGDPHGKYEQFLNLREWYRAQRERQGGFQLFNRVEAMLMGEGWGPDNSLQRGVTKLKQLAVGLQRVNPTDWNDMLGVLLTDTQ